MKRVFIVIATLLVFQLQSFQTTLLLARHGETDWNLEKRVQGFSDIPLNENGINQARNLAKSLYEHHSDISFIYSSDLIRAYQTALETNKHFLVPLYKAEALREINCGEAEGMKIEDKIKVYGEGFRQLNQKYPLRKERWNYSCVKGEETFNQLLIRFKEQLEKIAWQHPDKKVAIFSHSKAMGVFLADLIDSKDIPRFPNCGFFEITYDSSNNMFVYK